MKFTSLPPFGSHTYIMGIINITPDSFSGDGLMKSDQVILAALQQANRFIQYGAEILDIGGESTRPGSTPVTTEQELDRVIPVIQEISAAHPEIILSIDTYKARVHSPPFKLVHIGLMISGHCGRMMIWVLWLPGLVPD